MCCARKSIKRIIDSVQKHLIQQKTTFLSLSSCNAFLPFDTATANNTYNNNTMFRGFYYDMTASSISEKNDFYNIFLYRVLGLGMNADKPIIVRSVSK